MKLNLNDQSDQINKAAAMLRLAFQWKGIGVWLMQKPYCLFFIYVAHKQKITIWELPRKEIERWKKSEKQWWLSDILVSSVSLEEILFYNKFKIRL